MDFMLGQIVLFPYPFTPQNFLPCDGRLLQITSNAALYSLIGIQFGGDGRSTFGLPNYKANAPAGSTYCMSVTGYFPQRPD